MKLETYELLVKVTMVFASFATAFFITSVLMQVLS